MAACRLLTALALLLAGVAGQLEPPGFDLDFLNQSHHRMVALYEAAEGDGCELDGLVDRLLPPDYQVAQHFDLASARRAQTVHQSLEAVQHLIQFGLNASRELSPLLQRLGRQLSFLVYELQLTPQCMSSLVRIANAARANQLWALRFIDATGKLPSGVLDGTLSSLGDYSQCLAIRDPEQKLQGKYCLARPIIPYPDRHRLPPPPPPTGSQGLPAIPGRLLDDLADLLHLFNGSFIHLGLCLPSTCTADDVQHAINSVLYPITGIPVEIGPESTCQQQGKPVSLDPYQWMALSVLLGLALLCSLSSFLPDHSTTARKLLAAFSLLDNTRQMFEPRPNKFESVDFVRLLMLMLTVVMHQYYVAIGWSTWPFQRRLLNGLLSQVGSETRYGFLRNTHCTDFFFALSGLLLAYSMLGSLDRAKGRFNYAKFVVMVYLRFYPAVFGAILFYYLLPLLGDGPFWHRLDQYHVHACRQHLVPSLLSYNFYLVDLDQFIQHSMCNVASWWVNSCFHLMLLAPAVILPLHRFGTGASLALLLGTVLAGCAVSVGHLVWAGVPYMTHLSRMDRILDEVFYSIFYTWPFIHHLAPFAAGILTGYLIKRHPNLYLGGAWGESLLTVAFSAMTALAGHWTQHMLKAGRPGTGGLGPLAAAAAADTVPVAEVYLNITVGKLMFCAGFLWLFYLCCTGRAPRLNRCFTWPRLQPLYSLSLCIYLTNFIPPLWLWFGTRQLVEFTDLLLIQNLAFNVATTVVLSYLLHVLFERPVANLLKILQSN